MLETIKSLERKAYRWGMEKIGVEAKEREKCRKKVMIQGGYQRFLPYQNRSISVYLDEILYEKDDNTHHKFELNISRFSIDGEMPFNTKPNETHICILVEIVSVDDSGEGGDFEVQFGFNADMHFRDIESKIVDSMCEDINFANKVLLAIKEDVIQTLGMMTTPDVIFMFEQFFGEENY